MPYSLYRRDNDRSLPSTCTTWKLNALTGLAEQNQRAHRISVGIGIVSFDHTAAKWTWLKSTREPELSVYTHMHACDTVCAVMYYLLSDENYGNAAFVCLNDYGHLWFVYNLIWCNFRAQNTMLEEKLFFMLLLWLLLFFRFSHSFATNVLLAIIVIKTILSISVAQFHLGHLQFFDFGRRDILSNVLFFSFLFTASKRTFSVCLSFSAFARDIFLKTYVILFVCGSREYKLCAR